MSGNATNTPFGEPSAPPNPGSQGSGQKKKKNIENAKASLIALASVPHQEQDMHTAGDSFQSTLADDVVEELEKTNPGVLDWLRSNTGMMFQAVLLLSYIVVEVLNALATSYVLKPTIVPGQPKPLMPMSSSLIVMNTGISIILGTLITTVSTIKSEGRLLGTLRKSLAQVFNPRNILNFAPVAAMFSISACFSMLAYTKLDAGMKKILDQSRLPVTAALSACITGKKYSMLEWLALLVIILSVLCFYLADVQHDEMTQLHTKCHYPPQCFPESPWNEQAKLCALGVDGATISGTVDDTSLNVKRWNVESVSVNTASKTEFAGLVFSMLSTTFNCIGSLLSEKLMRTSKESFPAQKAQMEATGFPVAIAMSFLVPLFIDSKGGAAIWWSTNDAKGSGLGFFQGYSWTTGIAIAIDMTVAWMGGLIVKRFSSVVKIIAKCFVLLLVVFSTGAIWKPCQADSLPMNMWNLAFILIAATLLFSWMPKPQAPSPAPMAPTESSLAAHGRNTPLVEGQLEMGNGKNQVAAV